MIAEQTLVEIELAGNFTREQCVVGWMGLIERPANTKIIPEVDHQRFFEETQQDRRNRPHPLCYNFAREDRSL